MIVSNDRRAAAEAARYLESLGHRRIAIITGPDAYRSAHERRAGFLTALEERGVKLPAAMIMEGGYTFESGVTCAETLLAQKPRPTAIFAANDEMAAGNLPGRLSDGAHDSGRLVRGGVRRQPGRVAALALAHHHPAAHSRHGQARGEQTGSGSPTVPPARLHSRRSWKRISSCAIPARARASRHKPSRGTVNIANSAPGRAEMTPVTNGRSEHYMMAVRRLD